MHAHLLSVHNVNQITVKLLRCEQLGTRAQAFTSGGVHISHLFIMLKIQMEPGNCVNIIGGVHISEVFL